MTSQILAGLNPPQKEAVQAIDGPVLIFAGAGSGKTRVLTHRIAYMIHEHHIQPSSILAVTFTNKAAGELRTRVNAMVGQGYGYVNVGTFHSICSRILRAEAESIGYTQNFTIYDDSDGQRVVKDIIAKMKLSTDYYKPSGVFYQIKAAKNKMQDPAEMSSLAMSERDKKIAEIYESYEVTLRANNAMDFDDLLLKPLELFENNPAILKYYQQKFQYVLVDEYQDTNQAQFKFIDYLVRVSKNVCVVGDDDQSIYGWRGADISNILDFKQIYPSGKVFKLEQNYRSTATIIKAASAVVSKNSYRADKELWTESGKGAPIKVLYGENEMGEGQAILNEVYKHKQKGIALSDMAILYRTNAQSRALEDVLRRNAVPYQIVGGTKFYDRKEIKDILAYFRLIINPADSVALMRIINVPSRKLGKVTVEKLAQHAITVNKKMFDVLGDTASTGLNSGIQKRVGEFYAFIQRYKTLLTSLPLHQWATGLVNELGFIQAFELEDTPDSLSRVDNIHELLSALEEFEKNNEEATLAQYMEEVSLLSDIDQFNEDAHKVTLMTLHAAKGLEFNVVFLAGMEQGLFPLERGDAVEDMEEERRLFYVGLTRAKQVAYLTYAMRRMKFGSFFNSEPSMFIGEIPLEFLKFPQKETVARMSPTKKAFTAKKKVTKTKPQVKTFAKRSSSLFGESKEKSTSDGYEIGQQVKHTFFGKGTILKVEGSGPEARLTIVFAGSTKKLVAKFANLEVLD